MTIEIEYLFAQNHPLTLGAAELGYRVIQAWRYEPGRWVVLCQAPAEPGSVQPFVVWIATAAPTEPIASFHWGDYRKSLPAALAAFQAKAEHHGAGAIQLAVEESRQRQFERRAMRQIKAERAHKADHTLTAEQLEALQAWRGRYGAGWKQRLLYAWRIGTDANAHLGHALRQLRNSRGPAWLDRFNLSQANAAE